MGKHKFAFFILFTLKKTLLSVFRTFLRQSSLGGLPFACSNSPLNQFGNGGSDVSLTGSPCSMERYFAFSISFWKGMTQCIYLDFKSVLNICLVTNKMSIFLLETSNLNLNLSVIYWLDYCIAPIWLG